VNREYRRSVRQGNRNTPQQQCQLQHKPADDIQAAVSQQKSTPETHNLHSSIRPLKRQQRVFVTLLEASMLEMLTTTCTPDAQHNQHIGTKQSQHSALQCSSKQAPRKN
jgi:hypothetical protein